VNVERTEKVVREGKVERIVNFGKTESLEIENVAKIGLSLGTGDLGGMKGFGRVV
jgi:hypothetical protein